MSIQNVEQANLLFMNVLKDVSRKVKPIVESDQQRAHEAFYKAVRSCDKATERMVDKHLENVKKSAEAQAEYRKKKAVVDQAKQHADDMKTMNENILIERINHRNMLEELRIRETNRRELLEDDGG
jgi:ribosomal protein L22